jgi:hypothetical protein
MNPSTPNLICPKIDAGADEFQNGPVINSNPSSNLVARMDFFEWLFPEQAQAVHLRRLADGQARTRLPSAASAVNADQIDDLARENRDLRLYLTAMTQLLVEKGLIRMEDLQAKVMTLLPPLPETSGTDENPFAGLNLDN